MYFTCTCNLDTEGLTGGCSLSSSPRGDLVGFLATIGGGDFGSEENRSFVSSPLFVEDSNKSSKVGVAINNVY